MFGTPVNSPTSSPGQFPSVETPVHRASRRLLGLSPEFGPLPGTLPVTTRVQDMADSGPAQVTLLTPLSPVSFHGNAYEDAEDWLDEYERVAKYNEWHAGQKLSRVYFALEDAARTWFVNREGNWPSWDEFRRQFLDTFGSTERRDHAQRLLESRIQKPNETVAMFAEDMARLFRRADPDMSETKKLSHLMRGVKEQLFAGLVRNPPTTVDDFIKESTAIERALHLRCRQYDRSTSGGPASAAAVMVTDEDSLRRIIREIVQEEMKKLTAAPSESTAASVAEVVRQEIRQAFSAPDPNPQTRPLSYADVVRRPPPPVPTPQYVQQSPPASPWYHREQPTRPPLRRTDIWRTADYRPLCFHCGEAGHICRHCPYRFPRYQAFPSSASRRPFDDGRTNIDANSTSWRTDSPGFRSRSPSPGHRFQPARRSSTDVARGRSPSPRRGN